MILGRFGCQFSGTWDQTYGAPTGLPWAWDYGDGIGRHPTALYEIMLVALAWLTSRHPALRGRPGAVFAWFMAAYCGIRLGLEFLKPPFGAAADGGLPVALYGGLSAIQWAAVLGMAGYGLLLKRRLQSMTT